MIDCGLGRSSDLFRNVFAAFPWRVWRHSDTMCKNALSLWNSQQRDCSGFAPDSLLAPFRGNRNQLQKYKKNKMWKQKVEKKVKNSLFFSSVLRILCIFAFQNSKVSTLWQKVKC